MDDFYRQEIHPQILKFLTSFRLPQAAAAQMVPAKIARTVRRQAAAVRPPKVRTLPELHEKIAALEIQGYTTTTDAERIISRAYILPDTSCSGFFVRFLLFWENVRLISIYNKFSFSHASRDLKMAQ